MSKLIRPMSAEKVIESLAIISEKPVIDHVDQGMKGAIIGILDSLLGSRVARNSALFRLFPGKWGLLDDISSKELSEGQWYALKRWIGPHKPEGEKWQGSTDFVIECAQINYYLDVDQDGKQLKLEEEHLTDNSFFEDFCYGRFGHIPVMACGHEANNVTAIFNPFCSLCCDGGKNKEAYAIKADIPLKESVGNGNIDQE